MASYFWRSKHSSCYLVKSNSTCTINKSTWNNFSKFYGKVGLISWLLFHLIWKNYVLYWDFDLKSWIVDFFTCFTREKTPQNNFSCQNFSVENNYFFTDVYACSFFSTSSCKKLFFVVDQLLEHNLPILFFAILVPFSMIHQIISHLKKDMESLYSILSINIVQLSIKNYRDIFTKNYHLSTQ